MARHQDARLPRPSAVSRARRPSGGRSRRVSDGRTASSPIVGTCRPREIAVRTNAIRPTGKRDRSAHAISYRWTSTPSVRVRRRRSTACRVRRSPTGTSTRSASAAVAPRAASTPPARLSTVSPGRSSPTPGTATTATRARGAPGAGPLTVRDPSTSPSRGPVRRCGRPASGGRLDSACDGSSADRRRHGPGGGRRLVRRVAPVRAAALDLDRGRARRPAHRARVGDGPRRGACASRRARAVRSGDGDRHGLRVLVPSLVHARTRLGARPRGVGLGGVRGAR